MHPLKPLFAGLLVLGSASHLGCGGGVDASSGFFPAPTTSGAGGTGSGAGGEGGSGGEATTGGSGGSGGAMGPVCAPAGPFDGPVLTGGEKEWTWVPVKESLCRDGSETGFGVRMNPASDKLIIYLEGGGACFNSATCAINPSSFSALAFDGWKSSAGQTGIFNTDNADNPLRDWNAIYVPYCTGDIHGGNADHADVPGFGSPKNQSFVGYANIGHYLKRIVPTFSNASQVLLTGISAGGFGAAYNYDRIAEAFCPTPVTLLDDSGPPMSDAYLAPCLQKQWKELWNMKDTLPSACSDCYGADGGGIVNYTTYIAEKYPNSRLGLISSDKDSVISLFFGFGENDCKLAIPLSGQKYSAGLDDLRDKYLTKQTGWGTYFVDSVSHTYLVGPSFFTTEVDGVKLSEWVGALVDGGAVTQVGP